jgi:hypothetical protein
MAVNLVSELEHEFADDAISKIASFPRDTEVEKR